MKNGIEEKYWHKSEVEEWLHTWKISRIDVRFRGLSPMNIVFREEMMGREEMIVEERMQ